MEVFDILIDENNDLAISAGDLSVGESTLQHQNDLLLSVKGEWKQNPDVGVGLINYLNDDYNPDELKQSIQSEFEKDGMRISKLELNNLSDAEINAAYK